MPPFITAFKTMLGDVSDWMLYIVPVAIVAILIWMGIKLYQANDPHDSKEVKTSAKRMIGATALVGSATWIGNYVWGLFS